MALKFTDAIEEVESGGDFVAYLKEHAPGLIDQIAGDLGKNFTAGDVHVPAAGGEDPKKKKKPIKDVGDRISVGYAPKDEERERTAKLLDRVLNPREKLFDPENATFDEAGSDSRAFDYWVNKLKLKHKTSLEADAGELKALAEALKDNQSLRAALQQALGVAVGKAGAVRTIRVIRHGATHLNNMDTSVDRVRGWTDVPLSDEGKEEAQKLADKLAKEPPDHLVTSDLNRAHETAKLIAAACDMKIDEVSKGFRPWNVGKYAGQTSKIAVPILCNFAVEHPDQVVPEGECFNDFRLRFFNALSDAVDKYPGVLAVVTHHRGERLLSAWEAAGFPADGTIDGKEFSKKGEATAGYEDLEIPVDRLNAAANANVTKWVGEPVDYDKVFEKYDENEPRDEHGEWTSGGGSGGKFQIEITRSGQTKTAKNPITGKPHEFGSQSEAQVFADSMAANWRADYRSQGRRAPTYRIVAKAEAQKDFTLNVCKVDAEKQIFYGWAYISEENGKILVDKQDDYIEPQDLLKAAEDFTLQGGKLGDMHDQRNVGRVVASFVTTEELCKTFGLKCDADRRGWILGFKVDDPAVWAKIKGGAQLELSIGGKGERVPS